MIGTEPHTWETGLMDNITYVGLDVYQATVCIAVAESGRGGEVSARSGCPRTVPRFWSSWRGV